MLPLLEENNIFLSFITQLELLGSRNISDEDKVKINQFLAECTIIDITQGIKEFAISLRQNYSLKLPDCIIMATSLWLNIPLVTADKDFKKIVSADLIFFK